MFLKFSMRSCAPCRTARYRSGARCRVRKRTPGRARPGHDLLHPQGVDAVLVGARPPGTRRRLRIASGRHPAGRPIPDLQRPSCQAGPFGARRQLRRPAMAASQHLFGPAAIALEGFFAVGGPQQLTVEARTKHPGRARVAPAAARMRAAGCRCVGIEKRKVVNSLTVKMSIRMRRSGGSAGNPGLARVCGPGKESWI